MEMGDGRVVVPVHFIDPDISIYYLAGDRP